MSAEFIEPIGIDEARRRLPEIAAAFRNHERTEPIVVGAYRRADIVIVSLEDYRHISDQRTDRAEAVADALGSLRAEGLDLTPAGHEDADRYIDGELTADDLVARAVARHRHD